MEKITKFDKFRQYINSLWAIQHFTRSEMLDALDPTHNRSRESVYDHYRKACELYGIIERVGIGKYKLLNYLSIKTRLIDIRKAVYPSTYGKQKRV
jgi:hypothetical protein